MDAIRDRLSRLEPAIPWAHHFDLLGVETITREQNEQFYKKAQAVKSLGRLALSYFRTFADGLPLSSARVLDVASAEGGLSVEFAQAGASEVVGIEGRQLYVDRANFVIETLGLRNARFLRGDVRKISALEPFDFTIFSGILHHLGKDDFFPFLVSLATLTRGTMFLYTHVSTPDGVAQFRLVGPVEAEGGFAGSLFREHADAATAEQRERQVRASLDNTFSFWATEEALIAALKKAGFNTVAKMFEPHAFAGYANRNLRVIFIARK